MMATPRRRRARFAFTLVPITAALVLAACGLLTTPAQVLARVDKNLAIHDYRAAAVDLENLVAKRPDDPALRVKLGQALLHTGAYLESEVNLQRAQKLGVPWGSIVNDLAEALLGEGKPQQALDVLDAHGPKGVRDTRALALRGRALLALGKLDDARSTLARAIAADPADMPARVALASLLERQADIAGAKSVLVAAAAAGAGDFSVHLALGRWYAQQRQISAAHSELGRALDLAVAGIRAGAEPSSDEFRALAPLAEIELMQGDVVAAQGRLDRMRKLAAHAPATLLLQARIDLQQKRIDDARTQLQAILSRDPHNEAAQVLLGAADAAAGQLEQADMYLTAALAAVPGDHSARKLLAEVQLRESKPQAALHTVTAADITLDADLLALAGQASAQSGDLQGATTYLERSEQAAPQDKMRALQLATAYLAGHRAADAVQLLQGLQVPESLAPQRERLMLAALSQAGKPADVQAEAKRYAAANPHDVAALLLAAQALAATRDVEGARALLNEATRADPASPRPWIALAMLDSSQGKREAAETAFHRALQADPRSLGALVGEARLLIATGDPARAVVPLEKARGIAPNDANVWLLSGALALAQGHGPDAVGWFTRLTARYPKSAVLQADLARAFVLARRPTDARAAIAEAMKLDPRYWPAVVIDVSLALEARDLDAAQQLLPLLRASQAPRSVVDQVSMSLANSLLRSDKRAAASKQYEAVLADQPKQLIALNNLAWLRLEAGKPDSALTLARQAYALAPNNTSVEDTFGWALVQSGHATDAVRVLRAAHSGAPTDAQIHLHWATALLKTGATQDARRELRAIAASVAKSPERAQARQLLAGFSGAQSR